MRRWCFQIGFRANRKSAQATRICRTGGHQPVQQCLRIRCVAGKRKKPRLRAWRPRRALHLPVSRHHVHRSSRCSSPKARAHALPTTTSLPVGAKRPRRQRRRVSTRHQSIDAARHFKSIPCCATLSALYGRTAAQGARPGPGQVSGRAARGDPRTSLVSRKVDRRIGYRPVAMRNWYTTLLPTWPQGRHSWIAAVPTPAWYQQRSCRAHSSVFSLFSWQFSCCKKVSLPSHISGRLCVWRTGLRLALP